MSSSLEPAPRLKWITKLLVRGYFKLFHQYEALGQEHLPPHPPVLVLTNHVSNLDVPAFVLADPYPGSCLIAKASLTQTPIVKNVMAAWGGLRRANYFNKTQGAGVVFNRATAIAYRDRARKLEPFDDGAALANSLSYIPVFKTVTAGDVNTLCKSADHPDVLVLNQAVGGLSGTKWTPTVPYPELYRKQDSAAYRLSDLVSREAATYFIYRCSGS